MIYPNVLDLGRWAHLSLSQFHIFILAFRFLSIFFLTESLSLGFLFLFHFHLVPLAKVTLLLWLDFFLGCTDDASEHIVALSSPSLAPSSIVWHFVYIIKLRNTSLIWILGWIINSFRIRHFVDAKQFLRAFWDKRNFHGIDKIFVSMRAGGRVSVAKSATNEIP